jgi:hypothetical protein
MVNIHSKLGFASAQAMLSSEQQLGWLGRPGGGNSDFRTTSITDIKFVKLKKKKTKLRGL